MNPTKSFFLIGFLISTAFQVEFKAACYSPGEFFNQTIVEMDMKLLKELGIERILTYNTGDEMWKVPAIASKNGIETWIGCWVSDDKQKNEEEIQRALKVATSKSIPIIVGNEYIFSAENKTAATGKGRKELTFVASF